MKKLLIPLVAVGLAVGCVDAPTGTDGLTPNFGVAGAGNSGCYAVNFKVDLEATSPLTFHGDVTGDLTGFNDVEFESTDLWVVTGKKTKAIATVDWNVSHEDMGSLEFTTLAKGGFITAPDNSPSVWEVHSTERASSGVAKANLADWGTFHPLLGEAHLQYRGVICP